MPIKETGAGLTNRPMLCLDMVMKRSLEAVFFFVLALVLSGAALAGVIDAVAAFVDEDAITLRELDEAYGKSLKARPDMTRAEALNALINRRLLLREAKRLRFEAPSEEELLRDYIEMKVRAFIKIEEHEIADFYDRNKKEFKGVKLEDARDKIEAYLQEKEVNEKLKDHIEALRQKAYIKINLP